MTVQNLLEQKHVPYVTMKHTPTFTAQELAAAEHVRGDRVAKVVVASAGDEFYMLVLPACYNVRFDRLGSILGRQDCRLATEEELGRLFPDCELGAMPPFGRQYNLTTIVDLHLAAGGEIIFESGHHDEAVRVKWADYVALEQPRIAEFAEHMH